MGNRTNPARNFRPWVAALPILIIGTTSAFAAEPSPLAGIRRVVFLGDSITYSGGYIELVEAELRLRDPALRKQWEGEVAAMRNRINGMRQALVKALKQQGVPDDYSFIERQRGMFSFSGLTKEQVAALQNEHAIYAVGSGRIDVAGLTPSNIDRVAECIGAVVGQPV